jgi:anti-sigma-K factor RskA
MRAENNNENAAEFEHHARQMLQESILRIDGHVRSRLNQGRQAAVAEAARARPAFWRSFTLMPAAGAVAAAALVAMVLWHHQPRGELPVLEGQHSNTEDLELLADSEGLDLMEEWDGSFYEWAAEQTDANGDTEG